MKVVLLRDISKLGQKGTITEVANGYALNVLVPKGWAQIATDGFIKDLKAKEDAKVKQRQSAHNLFMQLVEKLHLDPIKISGLKHKNSSLFAHVSPQQITDTIYKAHSISLNPRQIHIKEPIKHLGVHNIVIEESGKRENIQVIVSE